MAADAAAAPVDDALPELCQTFRTAMSHAACTTSLVTTDGAAGRFGIRVSALAPIAADGPRPTLLVCIHHLSPVAAAIMANGVFCVNVLGDAQVAISERFAGRLRRTDVDSFAAARWTRGLTGAPRIAGGLAAFDCRLQSQQRIGTHHVLIGEVQAAAVAGSASPMMHATRAYGSPAPLPCPSDAGDWQAEALGVGVFQSVAPYLAPAILDRLAREGYDAASLFAGDQDGVIRALRHGHIDLALACDFDLGSEFEVIRLADLRPHALLPEAHPLAARDAVALADLAPHPMVLLDAPPSGRYVRAVFEAAGLTPRVRYRSTSFETVRGLVARGLGYAILTTKPATAMSYDGRSLVTRQLTDRTATSPIALIVRRGGALPPAAAAFAAAARALFD